MYFEIFRENTTMGFNCESYSLRDRVEPSTSTSDVYCLRDREPVKKTPLALKCTSSSVKEIKIEHEVDDPTKPCSSNSSFRQYRNPSNDREESFEHLGDGSGTETCTVKDHITDSHNASRGESRSEKPRHFEVLSDSESSSSQDDCDSSTPDAEASRPNICTVKKKLGAVKEDNPRDSTSASIGVVAALRSRSSLTLSDKTVVSYYFPPGGRL